MSRQAEPRPIVVGVDGTESALRAALWAARQARGRHAGLRLVHAFEPALRHQAGVDAKILRAQGTRWLATTRDAVAKAVPDLPIETFAAAGAAAELLITESATAELVVLGSRGLGGFTGLLVGSTAIAVAGRARCPMVVMCGHGEVPTSGAVVVGVDGTTTSDDAIAFAFAEASLRDAELVAVHCWTEPAVYGAVASSALVSDYDLLADEAVTLLAEQLAPWRERYPDVRVTPVVVHGRPARTLLAHKDSAQLIVVGTRGRGGFRGLVLGSTSQQLLQHATCPVAVVRTRGVAALTRKQDDQGGPP